MTTLKNQTMTLPAEPGFQAIPARIREVPPLILKRDDQTTRNEVLQTLTDLGSKLANTHRIAAEAYLSQGEYGPALTHLQAATTFAPGRLEYLNQLGNVRYMQGDDQGALQSFQAVLEIEPTQPDAWFNVAMIRFGLNDLVGAEEAFRRSLDRAPDNAEAWNNRGVCLFQLRRPVEARACFDRALAIEPDNTDARVNIASC